MGVEGSDIFQNDTPGSRWKLTWLGEVDIHLYLIC